MPVGSDLAKRYLEMMAQQEDKIASLQTQLGAAEKAAEDAEKTVSDYIRSLHM